MRQLTERFKGSKLNGILCFICQLLLVAGAASVPGPRRKRLWQEEQRHRQHFQRQLERLEHQQRGPHQKGRLHSESKLSDVAPTLFERLKSQRKRSNTAPHHSRHLSNDHRVDTRPLLDSRHNFPYPKKVAESDYVTTQFTKLMAGVCRPDANGYFGSVVSAGEKTAADYGDATTFDYSFELTIKGENTDDKEDETKKTSFMITDSSEAHTTPPSSVLLSAEVDDGNDNNMNRILSIINDAVMDAVLSHVFPTVCVDRDGDGRAVVGTDESSNGYVVTGFWFDFETQYHPNKSCASSKAVKAAQKAFFVDEEKLDGEEELCQSFSTTIRVYGHNTQKSIFGISHVIFKAITLVLPRIRAYGAVDITSTGSVITGRTENTDKQGHTDEVDSGEDSFWTLARENKETMGILLIAMALCLAIVGCLVVAWLTCCCRWRRQDTKKRRRGSRRHNHHQGYAPGRQSSSKRKLKSSSMSSSQESTENISSMSSTTRSQDGTDDSAYLFHNAPSPPPTAQSPTMMSVYSARSAPSTPSSPLRSSSRRSGARRDEEEKVEEDGPRVLDSTIHPQSKQKPCYQDSYTIDSYDSYDDDADEDAVRAEDRGDHWWISRRTELLKTNFGGSTASASSQHHQHEHGDSEDHTEGEERGEVGQGWWFSRKMDPNTESRQQPRVMLEYSSGSSTNNRSDYYGDNDTDSDCQGDLERGSRTGPVSPPPLPKPPSKSLFSAFSSPSSYTTATFSDNNAADKKPLIMGQNAHDRAAEDVDTRKHNGCNSEKPPPQQALNTSSSFFDFSWTPLMARKKEQQSDNKASRVISPLPQQHLAPSALRLPSTDVYMEFIRNSSSIGGSSSDESSTSSNNQNATTPRRPLPFYLRDWDWE